MKNRKPIDLVEEMLSRGEQWSSILSVGRTVRNGTWAKEIVRILKEKKLLPDNPEKALKQRDQMIKEQREKEIKVKKLQKTPYLPITNSPKKKRKPVEAEVETKAEAKIETKAKAEIETKAEAKIETKTEAPTKTRTRVKVKVKVDLDTCQKAWEKRQDGMSWTKIEACLGMKPTKGMNAYRASKRWEKTK